MKDYNNSPFYNSKAWKRASAAYMASKHYICERCGRPAQICHHKTYLNGTNVHDPAIALSFDNLEALCRPLRPLQRIPGSDLKARCRQ